MKLRFSLNCRSISVFAVLMFMGICVSSVWAQPSSQEEAKRMRIDSFISVAKVQIQRGFYPDAQAQLKKLQTSDEFSPYLSDQQSRTIESLLKKISQATSEQSQIDQTLQQCQTLTAEGKYHEALVALNQVKESPYATVQQQQAMTSLYADVSAKAEAEQQKWQTLYNESVALYNAGDKQAAREGFVKVANSGYPVEGEKMPADYITMIDTPVEVPAEAVETLVPLVEETPADKTAKPTPVEVIETPAEVTETVEFVESPVEATPGAEPGDVLEMIPAPAEPAQQEQSYLQVINAKNQRLTSYTKAVVNDSLKQASNALTLNDFDAARTALRRAFSVVEKNKMLLGDVIYKDYQSKLTNLSQTVDEKQVTYTQEQDRITAVKTDELTKQIRETMETQRQQAIVSYMERTYAFMDQQRYDEALGQLEQLLAIDQLNQRALILKKSLEHTVSYIDQRQIQEQADREEIELLKQADRKGIPYANDINFPRNWKEIAEKRKELLEEGMSPADLAVSRQLEKSVDLSMLDEDTTFEEAIDILRNSVDPALTIIVLWSDLSENAFVEKDTPINMSGEGLNNIVLQVGLTRLLQAVSAGGFAELGYVVENGVITIATKDSLPTSYRNETYDVADLLQAAANYDEDSDSDFGDNMGGSGSSGGRGGSGGRSGGRSGGSSRSGGGRSGGSGGRSGGSSRGGGSSGDDVGNWRSRERAYEIIDTIQETIEPDSWYDAGGEGRIDQFAESKLIVWQSPEVHKQIKEFLEQLRAELGQQVAVEARFLLVDENFLEDIGIDMQIPYIKVGSQLGDSMTVETNTAGHVASKPTGISSSLGGLAGPALGTGFTLDLDDFQANFIIRATTAHRNAKTLTAPKAMVMNGESATMRVYTDKRIKSGSELQTETTTTEGISVTNYWWENDNEDISTGVQLSVSPVITADKKYVLLRISVSLNELLGLAEETSVGVVLGELRTDTYSNPTTQTTTIQTRVMLPDQGTVMLGGLTLTAENQVESGAPGFSKLPLIGRLFQNRSDVRDKEILLIMVKPTIILKEEAEADAMAALSR